jgi:cytochrome bd ubiquinol oxidase subunit II
MPSLEVTLAGMMLISLSFYALMGGADYGAGVWHLVARGPRARAQQKLIADAIGPIWEANHVWLILAITVLFTAFPAAFSAITTRLHIPLTLMLIGIVLRGSAFAFRSDASDSYSPAVRSLWERIFAAASLFTPVVLGIVIGAIASGTLTGGTDFFFDSFVRPWLAPFPLAVGVFALALFAFLSAVYLILETQNAELRADFRRRALASAAGVAVLAAVVYALAGTGAPEIRHDLSRSTASWLLVIAVGCALGGILALWTFRFRLARFFAAAQVTAIVWGWGFSQFPYLVVPDHTIYNAAAPRPTLALLVKALLAGAILLFPSLFVLYRIFKPRAVFDAR